MHVLFWGLLVVALGSLLEPLWVGAIPPLTDFGGHVAMADVWARYNEVDLYREVYELRTGVVPNIVSARFTAWLHPWVSTMTAMRLFVSLTLVGTTASLLAVLRTFGRSRWLVFVALPFLWNGSLYWGMVNYLAIFPFFFGTIALARKTGQTGDWRWGLGLALSGITCFFVHGLGALFTYGASMFVLAISLTRFRDLLYLLAFVPGIGLWVDWKTRAGGRHGMPEGGIVDILREHGKWFDPMHNMDLFLHHTLDPVTAHVDSAIQTGLFGLWVLLMGISSFHDPDSEGTSRSSDDEAEASSTDETSGPWWRRWGATVYDWLGAGYAEARQHTLLLALMGLGVAAATFPAFILDTNVNTRVMDLLVLAAPLVPRLPRRSWLATVACGAAVVVSIGFGQYLTDKAEAFHRQEIEPLVKLAQRIPEQQRVDCIGVRGGVQPFFRGRPLDHNCHGLIQVERSSYGGCGFPKTGFNPVTFREGEGYPKLLQTRFRDPSRLQQWDYVVVRGQHRKPHTDMVTRVVTTGAGSDKQTRWTLYRVDKPDMPSGHSEVVGGSAGQDFQWVCPEGRAVAGFDGSLAPGASYISTFRPVCRPVVRDDDVPALKGRDFQGPQFGTVRGHDPFELRCPPGEFVLGYRGMSGKFIDQFRVVCGRVEASDGESSTLQTNETTETTNVGGKGGDPFEIQCPEGSIVRGVRGRSGAFVDAVGIQCVEAGKLTSETHDP